MRIRLEHSVDTGFYFALVYEFSPVGLFESFVHGGGKARVRGAHQ